MSVLESFIGNASVEHQLGTLSDTQYAAIERMVPTALEGIQGALQNGLQDQITAVVDSLKKSPPTISGAPFSADAPAFTLAMAQMAKACKAHGYEVATFSTTPGG
jgi:hypothetical protein